MNYEKLAWLGLGTVIGRYTVKIIQLGLIAMVAVGGYLAGLATSSDIVRILQHPTEPVYSLLVGVVAGGLFGAIMAIIYMESSEED